MAENRNLTGTSGADHIETGAGDDTIIANGGDDFVNSGAGDDYVLGGTGDDTLIGDAADNQVFSPGTINIVEDHEMTLTFDFEEAGYRNTIGTYKIDPETGEIGSVEVVWANASLEGSGGDLVSGVSSHTVSLNAGDQVGFFLIGDGFSKNNSSLFDGGRFEFVNAEGDAANIDNGAAPTLRHVADDGTVTNLNGHIYHSIGAESLTNLNPDGLDHTRIYSDSNEGVLQMGFEDLFNGGDLDFDDAVFTIEMGAANASALLATAGAEDAQGTGDDRLEGREGEDHLVGHGGEDLLIGGGAGNEWELVDGKWVYDPAKVSTADDPYFKADGADDTISGGAGEDVLIGNAGNDRLYAGSGDDRLIGGTGDDHAEAGSGDDVVNLEDGDDYAEGGTGDDTVNAGTGDDVVYGDNANGNLLQSAGDACGFAALGESGAWEVEDEADTGLPCATQTVETEAGKTYTLNFELAANMAAGSTNGSVEVLWNGEVIETFDTSTGIFDQKSVEITGTGEPGVLTFRNIPGDSQDAAGPDVNTDGPIFNYQKTVEIGGQDVDVAAFAPGQAKLYQMISGKLNVFDTAEGEYTEVGGQGFRINSIGFNVEDDLIYGIAKSNGTDALGNPVSVKDLVMVDAEGKAYRVGETPVADFVGDFDDQGNLWTFDASVNRITRIDVDNLDANGNPVVENTYLPGNFMKGNTYDIAFSAADQAFYALVPPSSNGGDAMLHKIDVSNFDGANTPAISSLPITGTLVDDVMQTGMAKGAYGAVFMDGDGNLYAGLNRGDHDLDASTGAKGGIYKINYDFDAGQAYAELMSEAQSTGSNDGAVDPRAADAFAEVDPSASVLIRQTELISAEGGNDDLRGGDGRDEMHGNAGADTLHGGNDDDTLHGDEGDDKVFGGQGDDVASGGLGADHVAGGIGDDNLGGDGGDDYLDGGAGEDTIDGGSGNDRIYSGAGDDVAHGGSGSDKIYTGDGADEAHGGADDDTIDLGALNDKGYGGSGADFIQGKSGEDLIDGGAGNDKLVGGSGADTIHGGAGDDHIWGGQWWRDGEGDTFVYTKGSNKDTIHDFEVEKDQIDLSSYGLSFDDLADRIIDRGWATEINLEGIDQSSAGDKILLKSIKPDDLDETNFLL